MYININVSIEEALKSIESRVSSKVKINYNLESCTEEVIVTSISEGHTSVPELVVIARLESEQRHYEFVNYKLSLHKVQFELLDSHSTQFELHVKQLLLEES